MGTRGHSQAHTCSPPTPWTRQRSAAQTPRGRARTSGAPDAVERSGWALRLRLWEARRGRCGERVARAGLCRTAPPLGLDSRAEGSGDRCAGAQAPPLSPVYLSAQSSPRWNLAPSLRAADLGMAHLTTYGIKIKHARIWNTSQRSPRSQTAAISIIIHSHPISW